MEERGVDVDHGTLNRWVVKFSLLLAIQAQLRKKPTSESWRMDETYIKVKGKWTYYYRAVENTGKTLDFMLSERSNKTAVRRFFKRAIGTNGVPDRVVIDKSGANLAGLQRVNVIFKFTGSEHDQDPAGQIPQQHHRTGSSLRKENHGADARLQGLPFCRGYLGWYRDRAHDPKGAAPCQRSHRVSAICGACSIIMSGRCPHSNVTKICHRTSRRGSDHNPWQKVLALARC
jgi:hypothetical protein